MSIIEDLKLKFRTGDVTTKLIFWNIILFVVPFVIFGILSLFGVLINFMQYVTLASEPGALFWKPWSILSYAFFHAGIWHIVFNLLMLNFAGRIFMTFFNERQLLGLYVSGALFAGAIYILSYMFFPALSNISTSLVGASASIMAILFATVTYSPMMPIQLLIFGNVRLWHIAIVLVIIDLIQLPASNTGGHLAHLGGALFGYIYTSQLRSGRDLSAWVSVVLDFIGRPFSKKGKVPFKKVHKNYTPKPNKTASKIVTKDKAQQQIDEILDKISKSGYDSLTSDEKEFLFRAGKE